MLKKLRNRMLLVNMVLLSLVMVASFSVIYAITWSNTQAENQAKLDMAAPLTSSGPMHGSLRESIGASGMETGHAPSFFLMVDKNGQLESVASLLDWPDEAYREALEKVWAEKQSGGKLTLSDRRWQYLVTSFSTIVQSYGRMFQEEHWQIAFLDITDSEMRLTQLLITFVLVGLGMLTALLGISLWLANRAIRPIEEIWHKQKQFVADASHELKTPMAIIGANMDAIEASGEETVDSQREWLSYIRAELKRMGRLVGDMLYLARAENTKQEHPIPFDLSVVCETAVASMEAMLYEKDIRLHSEIERDVTVRADEERIKQAVFILLDNAAKYTDEQGRITVSLYKEKGTAVFRVKNTGTGIPPEDLPKIFDRFYRPDSSRSEESGGYGLGLSIAKSIVERAGGSITAQSVLGLTTFTISLKWSRM